MSAVATIRHLIPLIVVVIMSLLLRLLCFSTYYHYRLSCLLLNRSFLLRLLCRTLV